MDKDNSVRWFYEWDLRLYEYTFKDFKKAPIGTKITFENGKTFIKQYYKGSEVFNNIGCMLRNYEELINFKDNWGYLGKIIKIEEPTYTEVYNNKEDVKEMTLAEVCKELGYNVKIVKEEK